MKQIPTIREKQSYIIKAIYKGIKNTYRKIKDILIESIDIIRLIYVSIKVHNIVNSSKYIKHRNIKQSS